MRYLLGIFAAFATAVVYSRMSAAGATSYEILANLAVVLLGLLVVDFVLSRNRPGPGPFRVYALLALVLLLIGAGVYALAQLGPGGTLLVVLGLGGAVATVTFVRRPNLRREREDTGLCGECGYDLRHSETLCPECGAAIPESLARRRRIASELLRKRGVGAEDAGPESSGETGGDS